VKESLFPSSPCPLLHPSGIRREQTLVAVSLFHQNREIHAKTEKEKRDLIEGLKGHHIIHFGWILKPIFWILLGPSSFCPNFTHLAHALLSPPQKEAAFQG